MIIHRHPQFKKSFKKRIALDHKLTTKTASRIQMFVDNPKHPLVRDHALTGSFQGLRAFWVTGDIRIIYRRNSADEVEFLDIGTHAQVYE